MEEEILINKPNQKLILLGNEAIVRGAIEAGVQFVSTYPGTPASEVGDTFARIFKLKSQDPKEANFYFEYSVNEKVALEAAIGASFSGLKTLIAMKDFGLNVCLDSLGPFAYTGVRGPTVIIVADDPSCYSSAQWEEGTRAIAYLTHLPFLEPADPQECLEFTKLAFEISEKFKIPVIIRTTTRVAHQRAIVKIGNIKEENKDFKAEFVKNPKQFVTLPPRVLEMKKELLEKIEKIRVYSEKSKINIFKNIKTEQSLKTKVGIITSGVSYLYVMETLKKINLDIPVLKLGFFYPLPEEKIKNFIKSLKKVLIVEELEPYLENEIKKLAKGVNCSLEVIGKEFLPEVGELKPEIVISAVAKIVNKKVNIEKPSPLNSKSKIKIPARFPQLCPGCPYWLVFNGIKKAVDPQKVIFGGDIGCYMLAGFSPHLLQDYLFNMGSSIGIAHGIKKSTNQKLITFIGDSTFFHAGIPALINTIFNKSNPLIIIMNNETTAMTGHQPFPSSPAVPNSIKIEDIVLACGVKNLKIIDPINQEEFINTIKDFLNKDEVSVIIVRRPCIWVKNR